MTRPRPGLDDLGAIGPHWRALTCQEGWFHPLDDRMRPEGRTSHRSAGTTLPPGWTRILEDPASNFTIDRYSGEDYSIGHFRCPPGAQAWRQENIIGRWDLAVVPGNAVEIIQQGRKPVIATANRAVFYNAHQAYERRLLDPRGDDCIFFALPREAIREILSAEGIETNQDDQPFDFSDASIAPGSYLRFHRLLRELRHRHPADGLQTREEVFQIVRELARSAAKESCRRVRRRGTNRRRRELALEVQRLLGIRFTEPLSLEDIANTVGASPYHTARVFRDHTGQSIHEYRTALRMHLSLMRLYDPKVRLVDLALDLGFSSHGHFTHQFHRTFGRAPSAIRREPALGASVGRPTISTIP